LAWIGRTVLFDSVVRNAESLCSPASPFRSPIHGRHIPAKAKTDRLSLSANQCVTFGQLSVHSQNDVAGTRQRHSAFAEEEKQCAEVSFGYKYGAVLIAVTKHFEGSAEDAAAGKAA
jgi:hypothetical protein